MAAILTGLLSRVRWRRSKAEAPIQPAVTHAISLSRFPVALQQALQIHDLVEQSSSKQGSISLTGSQTLLPAAASIVTSRRRHQDVIPGITDLDLSDNHITGSGGKELARLFIQSDSNVRPHIARSLLRLNLANNQLGIAGASALSSALLPSVNRQAYGIDGEGMSQRKKETVTQLPGGEANLEWLSLSNNRLQDAGAESLAVALAGGALRRLQTLELEDNALTDEGMRAIGAAMKACPLMHTLTFAGNWSKDYTKTQLHNFQRHLSLLPADDTPDHEFRHYRTDKKAVTTVPAVGRMPSEEEDDEGSFHQPPPPLQPPAGSGLRQAETTGIGHVRKPAGEMPQKRRPSRISSSYC
eukprot:TRINITY_DN102380_c0_g1_i1.p1 TRINITY_DN102380_c0_g1~~TRINITY_DN102380_c0_g1_i1.p1  ORF type:complete len:377 (-),score=80.45 TRINITY_DN102380_c0_g1_i1:208-1275(-)